MLHQWLPVLYITGLHFTNIKILSQISAIYLQYLYLLSVRLAAIVLRKTFAFAGFHLVVQSVRRHWSGNKILISANQCHLLHRTTA